MVQPLMVQILLDIWIRSYGAFGGDLGAEWDLDNDGYEFCYSMDNLDCTCLDSDDFDEEVNVDDEGICEE